VSMAYNIGVAGFRGSSVCRAHNRGDVQAAARAFGLWNKATVGGKKIELPGLTRRRAAEAALYLEPTEAQGPDPMPQAVEPERPMEQSQIVRGATVAGGTAALATVAEVVNTTNSIKQGVSGLNEWLVPILLIAVIGLCGYIVWERVTQRKKGWA
jgi:lysozyme